MWGFGALCFTVMAEVFSSKAREVAFSLSIVLMWSLNFTITKSLSNLSTLSYYQIYTRLVQLLDLRYN
uniref:Putative secreted protein n=1 Tax=Xenopsylla cheopis TaxID=163159 RepID=A0A6M2E3D8_XENCH